MCYATLIWATAFYFFCSVGRCERAAAMKALFFKSVNRQRRFLFGEFGRELFGQRIRWLRSYSCDVQTRRENHEMIIGNAVGGVIWTATTWYCSRNGKLCLEREACGQTRMQHGDYRIMYEENKTLTWSLSSSRQRIDPLGVRGHTVQILLIHNFAHVELDPGSHLCML